MSDHETELIITDSEVRLGSVAMSEPSEVLTKASGIAKELVKIIDTRKLYVVIKGKSFVYAEGWTTLGAMLGIVPRVVETVESDRVDGEFVTVIEAIRTSDGAIIGRATASCGPDEKDWKGRTRQARRSMSQTRATGKVMRLMLSWVMELAGYEVTPAEEMQTGEPDEHQNPTHNESAPKTQTRGKRVTREQCSRLVDDWKQFQEREGLDIVEDNFKSWVEKTCGIPVDDVKKPGCWSQGQLAKCTMELASMFAATEPPVE